MKAEAGKTYAQLNRFTSQVVWVFTIDELPEWNNEHCPAIDITYLVDKNVVDMFYVDGDFVTDDPNPAVIPDVSSITMRQCRLQLLALGVLDDVSAAIDSMGAAAKIEWEYAATVEKPNQLTTAMMQILEFDEEMANQFFYEASLL